MAENYRNLKMIIAYEGTEYAGFQRQKSGILTIQETLENAIFQITGEKSNLIGAGRTDAGVHAKGQVVNFKSSTHLETTPLLKALNAVLPKDIVIRDVCETDSEFHSRYSAKSKTYLYRIYIHALRPLFERNFVYHYRYQLDFDLMSQVAALIEGTHDFQCFQASGSVVKSTIRTVNYCRLSKKESEIRLYINADGFLYHMVRNIVGTMLVVGSKRITVAEFVDIVKTGERQKAGPTAPAGGLCLEEVFYS